MIKHPVRAGLVGAVLAAGSVVVLPANLSSASPRSMSFSQAQQQLEQQLANRVAELQRLSVDVAGSKTLSTGDAGTLTARLSSETAGIGALAKQVPTDTTRAELAADRAAMLRDNRVYAVMLPQVVEVVEADSLASQVTADEASESTLASSVSSLAGLPGYRAATSRYQAFVRQVGTAAADTARVDATVMPQVPQDFPGDTHVFVSASHQLLAADVALAHASYEETLLGLATGGYTGS